MEIKKIFANILFNITKRMIKTSSASYLSAGVEDMPESMKNLR